jgi:hypothetical protein
MIPSGPGILLKQFPGLVMIRISREDPFKDPTSLRTVPLRGAQSGMCQRIQLFAIERSLWWPRHNPR